MRSCFGKQSKELSIAPEHKNIRDKVKFMETSVGGIVLRERILPG